MILKKTLLSPLSTTLCDAQGSLGPWKFLDLPYASCLLKAFVSDRVLLPLLLLLPFARPGHTAPAWALLRCWSRISGCLHFTYIRFRFILPCCGVLHDDPVSPFSSVFSMNGHSVWYWIKWSPIKREAAIALQHVEIVPVYGIVSYIVVPKLFASSRNHSLQFEFGLFPQYWYVVQSCLGCWVTQVTTAPCQPHDTRDHSSHSAVCSLSKVGCVGG